MADGRWQSGAGVAIGEAAHRAAAISEAAHARSARIPPMLETTFRVRTTEREEILLITSQVDAALAELGADDGICTIIVPHTTCAISVNEDADPDVRTDLVKALRALVPKVKFEHG